MDYPNFIFFCLLKLYDAIIFRFLKIKGSYFEIFFIDEFMKIVTSTFDIVRLALKNSL